MKTKNKPHVHATLIKAWADGAQIQCRADANDEWMDTEVPGWHETIQYRIKPEPKKVEVHLYRVRNSNKGSVTCKTGERFGQHTEALYYEWLGSHTFEVNE